jgi:cytoskeletal protein CcmA (bactofilin family)
VNDTSAEWDSVYNFVNSDSATNNTDYNQTTFVNASGDNITGDLNIEGNLSIESELNVDGDAFLKSTTTSSTFVVSGHTTLNTLNVSGAVILDDTLDVNDNSVFHENVHIKGDLRVDGNAYLSAGPSGNINVGDTDTDNVVFRADVDSNFLADKKDTYTLGSDAKRWLATHSLSGLFQYVDIHDLDVSGVTKLTGKSGLNSAPGVIVRGTPTGIFDEAPYGFDDNGVPRADYMVPDVDIVGDVAIHGSLSADNAHIYSLTASHFKAEYEKLTINDGDMEMLNGSFKQRGGNVLIESDLGHVDDENTYMRFQPDEITFTCHDVQMLRFQELTTGDDIISIGDTSDAVDIIVQNPADNKTLYIDGDTGYIGIGTDNPIEKLHVGHGQVQFAPGDKNGAVMLTSGDTQERIDKTGSIRWNNELNRYEGYRDDTDSWVSLQSVGDTDGDTYISVDAGDYPDSDRIAIYTVGCSAMTIYPNQTVAFAGDIQFDNITIYDNNSVTGPLTATSEFIYLKVNGKDRAIRLWATPEDTREDVETFHGESLTHIGDECGLGLGGQIPTQTISAHPVLNNPPTQRTDVDSDGDGIIDYLDADDDNDGIPDYMDADHPLTDGMADADGDGIADPYDDDMFEGTHKWSGGGKTWHQITTPWESLSGNNK